MCTFRSQGRKNDIEAHVVLMIVLPKGEAIGNNASTLRAKEEDEEETASTRDEEDANNDLLQTNMYVFLANASRNEHVGSQENVQLRQHKRLPQKQTYSPQLDAA